MSVRHVPATPLSTYRLQFTPRFGFAAARAIVPYLVELGVGYLYASPYLKARPGSEHGYDVVDPNALNPEIGTPAEHAALIDASQAAGLGHLLDFVPNHMGIGVQNAWWQDVLEWGEASPYADFFDINWRPLRAEMHGKLLIPSLGDYYGRVLERGELTPVFEAESGTFAVAYFDGRFPLATRHYADILALAAEKRGGHAWPLRALAAEFGRASRERALELKRELAGVAADSVNRAAIEAALDTYRVGAAPSAIDRLDEILQQQHYRLAYWRVSADEINYRRFFDINNLAGLRIEDAQVLGQTHRLIFELIASGRIQGLRIDHVDGLYNPGGYCQLLHDRAAALGHPQYLVVEKILARFEHLSPHWRIAGTTGYDFMNLVNGLFVDSRAELAFDRIYRRFAGISGTFDAFAYRAKKDIIRTALASELEVLATMLDAIADNDRRSNDYTYNVLRDALGEVVASFPVYRTYVTSEDVDAHDRTYIALAIDAARKRSELGDEHVFGFLEDVLTMRLPEESPNYDGRSVLRFAMKFQQYTSPVMAKAVEDTAFYRYVRLASLNEVGGDPRRFGTSVSAFHQANLERAATFPHAMLATATHDHKRGEDTRMRIDALSEMPGAWERTIRRWSRLNANCKREVEGNPAPTDNDEYFLYQILIGTWPFEWLADDAIIDAAALDAYVERIQAYQRKAMREAKFRTSWTNPNVPYEEASLGFTQALLRSPPSTGFVPELQPLAHQCARIGAVSSIAQTVLKLMSPGVPDIYQGCEFWDLSLVDPDNRRPVDYAVRRHALAEMRMRCERGEREALGRHLLTAWHDGRLKAYIIWRLMHLRRECSTTFSGAAYTPLETGGARAGHLVAFERDGIIVVVPRLVRRLLTNGALTLAFGDETVRLPGRGPARYAERFTGATVATREDADGRYLAAADLLNPFPAAVLEPVR
ncbi:MAG: malto-oligosyltrehalose synthase [Candidatus Eremiobacteraeota bacterium]|nr:malto-oligosyltrehalose synthase [Candidatus Eremiobacteraeota bacterium]MBC5803747.1 malto-oligosyltrehalose synthase [Candidatus Eremiobacteraeota bacterium]